MGGCSKNKYGGLFCRTALLQCGFTIWPTNATLPDGSKYTYQVPPQYGDIIRQYVDSADAYGVGYGEHPIITKCTCRVVLLCVYIYSVKLGHFVYFRHPVLNKY